MNSVIKILLSREHWLELSAILIVGVMVLLYWLEVVPFPLLLIAVLFGLIPLASEAWTELREEKKIGTELFTVVAVVIAFLGGEYLAGAVVLMIILIAEYIASVSEERARASISDLIGQAPSVATVKRGTTEEKVEISELKIGDVVLVKAGEKIPVDGEVVVGKGLVNQAPVTGESVPADKEKGSEVFAGTLLESGALDIKVMKKAGDTVFAQILALVKEAEEKGSDIQRFADKVAGWLIPLVFVFILVVYLYTKDVKLIIALLIFTSPAEIGLATPLVTISALARSAREGILVKGGMYLEGLARAKTFIFDKTGTLTIGQPKVVAVEIIDKNISEAELIALAYTADKRSGHHLARAIVEYAKENKIEAEEPEEFVVINGRGVRAVVAGEEVLVGNKALLIEGGVVVGVKNLAEKGTAVFVARSQKLLGAFLISDTLRKGAKEMVAELKASGVEEILILTGDNEKAAALMAKEVGITEFQANLLPQDKIRIVREKQATGGGVVMVGDGINDAPALAAASVGVAMGGVGTASAMEAADIVLMNDDLRKIARAKAISQRAYKTIKENIIFGVGVVHITGIILVLMGVIGPVEAAIIHLVPDTLVFINSTKLLKVEI